MDEGIGRLRAEAQRLAQGRALRQVRYPDTFRRAAVALVRRHLRQGRSMARLVRELGVSEPTLTKWLRPRAQRRLRPVALTPERTPAPDPIARPMLITPTGVRVVDLDRDTLLAVLQVLG
jgi:transposase-like protein